MCLINFVNHKSRHVLLKVINSNFNLIGVQLISSFTNRSQLFKEELILKNTVVSQDHLTPEIKLRLITPECELYHCKATESEFPNDPFWGIYWPGGQALGRFVLDNKKLFQKKNIVDIGSGCGACAIAAALSGANNVLANDIDPMSIIAISMNSSLNNVKVLSSPKNLIGQDLDLNIDGKVSSTNYEIVLVGDMFYDAEFSKTLFIWLANMVKKGKSVLIGDPGRYALKDLDQLKNVGKLIKLAEFELINLEHNGFSSAAVYKGTT